MADGSATVRVATIDLRRALDAVVQHAEKNITGDNAVEHRVRLSFDRDHVVCMATNSSTTALARVPIIADSDSRKMRFAADDGAFQVDITPRHVALILQHFKVAGTGEPRQEELELAAHASDGGAAGSISVEDVGGLFAGESVEFQCLEFATGFPAVMDIVGRAVAGIGTTPIGKPLVADGWLLSRFRRASDMYDQPLDVRATGTPESRGFVVLCGRHFVGTVESRHSDDDWQKRREQAMREWLEFLPKPKRLEAAG